MSLPSTELTHDSRLTSHDLEQTVATAHGILGRLGLADYMGHASARVPGTDRIVTKPRHSTRIKGMTRLRAEQM
ncbi:MAG TPA: hypothetical protein VFA49_04750, partial [Chloroflexota bacterium]|nr:hypothetical protein [Chloroflexota bacterium]